MIRPPEFLKLHSKISYFQTLLMKFSYPRSEKMCALFSARTLKNGPKKPCLNYFCNLAWLVWISFVVQVLFTEATVLLFLSEFLCLIYSNGGLIDCQNTFSGFRLVSICGTTVIKFPANRLTQHMLPTVFVKNNS